MYTLYRGSMVTDRHDHKIAMQVKIEVQLQRIAMKRIM